MSSSQRIGYEYAQNATYPPAVVVQLRSFSVAQFTSRRQPNKIASSGSRVGVVDRRPRACTSYG